MTSSRTAPDLSWPEYVRRTVGDDKQVTIAERTGIDQGTISRWMRDKRAGVSSANARAFAFGYGRPVWEALIVAGHLSEDEAGRELPALADYTEKSPDQLRTDLQRHLDEIKKISAELVKRLPRPEASRES